LPGQVAGQRIERAKWPATGRRRFAEPTRLPTTVAKAQHLFRSWPVFTASAKTIPPTQQKGEGLRATSIISDLISARCAKQVAAMHG